METIALIALVLSALLPLALTIAILSGIFFIRRLNKEAHFKVLQLEAELTAAKNELTVKAKELEADAKDVFRNVNRFLEKLPEDPEYKESLKAYTDACAETAHTIEKIGERVSAFPLKKGVTAFLEAVKEDEPKAAEEPVEKESSEPSNLDDYSELMAIISDIDELWTTEMRDAMVNNPLTLRKAVETSEAIQKLHNMVDVDSDEPAIEDLALSVAAAMTAIARAYFVGTMELDDFVVGDFRTEMMTHDYNRAHSIAHRHVAN